LAVSIFDPLPLQAVVEILRLGKTDPANMDDEKKRETVENYIAFKTLMYKIDKDEDEYDEDGNVITAGPQLNARELQNLGMPSVQAPRGSHTTNGFSAPGPPPGLETASLPAAMRGMQFNPVIRMQNLPLSSLPGHQLPDGLPPSTRGGGEGRREASGRTASQAAPVPESGGYLDPETGDWVAEAAPRNTQVGLAASSYDDFLSKSMNSSRLKHVLFVLMHVPFCLHDVPFFKVRLNVRR
jgi:hypothetical protein